MRLLYHLHAFPPHHNAGAELYALELLRWFRARGHQTQIVLGPRGPYEPTYDGFTIRRRGPQRWLDRLYEDTDVAFTHLDETPFAIGAANRTGTPLVHVLHNDRQLAHHQVTAPDLVVANSQWVAATVPGEALVVHPPCPPARYQTLGHISANRPAILFVNPTLAKGAPIVYELARRHPERRFLIIDGGYGRPWPRPDLPNLEAWRNTHQPTIFYEEALLVLLPSIYESFGRVPVEAAASGIPTIARPLPGVVEALADAALYAGAVPDVDLFHNGTDPDRRDFFLAEVDAWDEALTRLLTDTVLYGRLSAAAADRAGELWQTTQTQLAALESTIAHL